MRDTRRRAGPGGVADRATRRGFARGVLLHPLGTVGLLLLVAGSAGVGTFIERAHGPLAARAAVYGSWWFLAMLAALGLQLIFVMIPRRGWNSVFVLHGSLVLMLLGGAITLATSRHGLIELRNGESTDHYLSQERYLEVGGERHRFDPHPWAGSRTVGRAGSAVTIAADTAAGEHAVVLSARGEAHRLTVPPGRHRTVTFGGDLVVRYGSVRVPLPFALTLDRFEMTTYPGSDVPASYASRVRADGEPHFIRMNDPLRSGTLRIFQTSYAADREGSVFSVTDDPGAPVFYLGCILLFGSLIVNLLRAGSRFGQLRQRLALGAALLALFGATEAMAQEPSYGERFPAATAEAAAAFGRLTVQAPTGRTQPLDTLNRQILRKLSRADTWHGLSANQVVVGMITRPERWQHAALIAVTSKDLREALGVERRRMPLTDFFTEDGDYRLRQWLIDAHAAPPFQRSKFDREVIAVDERVQIFRQLVEGGILQIMPVPGEPDVPWLTLKAYWQQAEDAEVEQGLRKFFDGGFDLDAERLIAGVEAIRTHQDRHGGDHRIRGWVLELELLDNRLRLFPRLSPILALTGIGLFLVSLVLIGRDRPTPRWLLRLAMACTLVCFLLTSLGILMRWLVAGAPPLTNTYENMIYIAWSSLAASALLLRHQLIGLAGGLLLAGFFFLGAHLNHLDPEITTLVPVLRSFWLLLHVTVVTASYGFLGLSACIGLATLVLACLRPRLPARVLARLSMVNELTMTLGLFLLVIGTFLGAIWASESWGRYWAWDPKETWALISIIVYVIITHLRLVPALDHPLLFATLSLWGYASILMTYFGVNFYLTGLHAYAGGAPAPLPGWAIVTASALALLTALTWFRNGYEAGC